MKCRKIYQYSQTEMGFSWQKFNNYISTENSSGSKHWSNDDLEQTPPERRTWRHYNFALVWFQEAYNVNEWNTGATLTKLGLPYWQAIIAAFVANFIAAIVAVAAARPGATYHIGYPTFIRSVFGMRGSKFFIAVRGAVAAIWFGVQTYFGAMMFDVAMRCMFGHKWTDIPNHLPVSADTTTRLMLSFFLYWLLQFPLMFIHPTAIRHVFTVKSFITPAATFGLFIFCVVKGHGPGTFNLGLEQATTSSAKGWAFMTAMNSVFGTASPMLINQPDISRYAIRPHYALYVQAAGFFFSKCLILVLGIIGTASIYRVYGEVYWNMWDLCNAILDNNWNAGARTGVFFVAAAFAFGTSGTNIFGNSIPFAADICGIFPRYFTILRGQVLVALLAWAIVPWKLLSDGTKFVNFLGSYGIFVGPLLGCMLADYFLTKRGNIHVPSLFDYSKTGLYHYYKGWNWWGTLVWACAPVLCIPGLYQTYYPERLSAAAGHLYSLGWLLTFTFGFVFYYLAGLYFKPAVFPAQFADKTAEKKFEYLVPTEGYFPEESEILDGTSIEVVDKGAATEKSVSL